MLSSRLLSSLVEDTQEMALRGSLLSYFHAMFNLLGVSEQKAVFCKFILGSFFSLFLSLAS